MSIVELEIPMSNNSHETRVALLEQSIIHNKHTMDKLEKITQQGFDNTERRFNNLTKHIDDHTAKLGERLDKYDHKIDKMDQRLWTNFYWMLGTLFTLSAAGAGILAKGFKWLT